MELIIWILIPDTLNLSHLSLKEDSYEWEGKEYSQGMPKYNIKDGWIIEATPIPNYIRQKVESKTIQTYKCLCIHGDGLNDFALSLINPEMDFTDNLILPSIFQNTVALSNSWIVVFEINNAPIIKVYNDTIETLESEIVKRIVSEESFISYQDVNIVYKPT
jgi:hypothetical protein